VFVEVLGEAELLKERVARREKFRRLMLAFTNRPLGRRDLAHPVRGKEYCSAVVGDENIACIDHQVAQTRRGEGIGVSFRRGAWPGWECPKENTGVGG